MLADRVKETSTSSGTGDLALAGAVESFQSFDAALSVGDSFGYGITDGTDFEIGVGTLVDATTLSRSVVKASSNAGNFVDWGTTSKEVFVTPLAEDLNKIHSLHTHKSTVAETWSAMAGLTGEVVTRLMLDASALTAGSAKFQVDGSMDYAVTKGNVLNRILGPTASLDMITAKDSWAIVYVDDANNVVGISGDHSATFASGDEFDISGSSGNDGAYTVSSVTYNSTDDRTEITTNEAIGDPTADGSVDMFKGTVYAVADY